MRVSTSIAVAALLIGTPPGARSRAWEPEAPRERIAVNDNRKPAGVLARGVLTMRLEVREGEWHPDAESAPGLVVHAFAEEGKATLAPGPLIRVPEGTEIRATVRNTLSRDTVVIRGLSTRGVTGSDDALHILPGAVREVRFTAGTPGTYFYNATTAPSRVARSFSAPASDAVLSGAFVIDPRGAPRAAQDRVLVLSTWHPTLPPNGIVARNDLLRFVINGKAWPNTERYAYAIGDSVRFRVINASSQTHPMHLHGFYFRVDARGDGGVDSLYDASGRRAPPQSVVTERIVPWSTIFMTWVPERAGNWMFHCHDNYHVLRNRPLDGTPIPAEHHQAVTNHSTDMMGGLVMGITVRGRDTSTQSRATPQRRLRLVAAVDSGSSDAEPAYAYALQDASASTAAPQPRMPGPVIVLQRGQPVSITVVNATPEATSVHWHGIELESYYDGVVDFSGNGRRLTPAIAPRDSFVALFTPPRSGTFMYHPHADEVRQQQAGLSGVLIVVDSLATYTPATDVTLLVSVPRRTADHPTAVYLNGSASPAPLDLRVGTRYRLRLVNIHTFRPNLIARLLSDSTPVNWTAVAKDGMPLPSARATIRPAVQQMGNGETFDFEFTPAAPGDYRFTISAAAGALLATMPVRVR